MDIIQGAKTMADTSCGGVYDPEISPCGKYSPCYSYKSCDCYQGGKIDVCNRKTNICVIH